MVRTKLILTLVASILVAGTFGAWLAISEKQASKEQRAEFFGSTGDHPTSGGQKMKVEW